MSNKLHVVLPTYGLSQDDILNTQECIHQFVSDSMNEDFELIDIADILNENITAEATAQQRIKYLGAVLQKIAEADVVAFSKDWQDSKECIIQHMVCALFDIPYVDTSVTYFNAMEDEANQVIDLTTDWDDAARINNVLSEEYEHDALDVEHDDSGDKYGIDDLEPGEYNADILLDDTNRE